MTSYIGNKSHLSGQITPPPSKSHTLRAILFASMAAGDSKITNYLQSPDTEAMIRACQAIGAEVEQDEYCLRIKGVSGCPKIPDDVLGAGNSGQVLRFIAAIAGLIDGYTVITGDHSIRHNRVMQPLIRGLTQMGVFCVSTKNDGFAPIVIKGPANNNSVIEIDGQDSQPVSAILIAASFLEGKTLIRVKNPGERPWIDLTLHWLSKMGVKYNRQGYSVYEVYGYKLCKGFDYIVPGDFSSVLYPLVAALVTRSEIQINNVDMNDVQGDKEAIEALVKLGAKISYDKNDRVLRVEPSENMKGGTIDINNFIDAVTILAVLGCYLPEGIKIINAASSRNKECDRLMAISSQLKKMGAVIEELPAGLIVCQASLHGAEVESFDDHRMAMSLVVASFMAEGQTQINAIQCINKSYPGFYNGMRGLGANLVVA